MAQMTITSFMTGIKNWVLGKIGAITDLIPTEASSSNKLADKAFVNSSIATATATFRGTYNVVSDLSLSYNATHAQIQTALATKMSALSITPDNNDYAFVQIPTADATPTQIAKIERYKYNGSAWAFEYELNNSGFTAAQWAAINSGITGTKVTKLDALPTNAELTTLLAGKQNVLTFDNVPTQNSDNPAKSGGIYSAIATAITNATNAIKEWANGIFAKIDGYYETMVVGTAKNLEGQNVTEGTFVARPTGGENAEVANGLAQLQGVKGNSVKWNQILNISTVSINSNVEGTFVRTERGLTITATSSGYSGAFIRQPGTLGHKYYIHFLYKGDGKKINIGSSNVGEAIDIIAPSNYQKFSTLGVYNDTVRDIIIQFYNRSNEATTIDIDNLMVIDLTLIFGAGNEPSTVAEFEEWLAANVGLQEYYPYSEGSVLNVNMTGLESFKKNLLNPTTGKAEIIGAYSEVYGNYYGICGTYGTLTFKDAYGNESTITPDADGKFELNVAGELTVADAGADCAVFLWWDGTDTEYSEYGTNIAKLDISHIYGKKNGEGNLVQVWPTGMPKVNDIVDLLKIEDGAVVAKRVMQEVDLGTLSGWALRSGTTNVFQINPLYAFSYKKRSGVNSVCSVYSTLNVLAAADAISGSDKQVSLYVNKEQANKVIYLKDSGITSSDIVSGKIAKLNGVMLYYELETPETYTDLVYMGSSLFEDGTPVELPVNYEVDNWGIERILPLNTPSAMVTSAPTIECKYSLDAVEQLDTHTAEIADLYDKNVEMDAKKADIDGYYNQLSVGSADNLRGNSVSDNEISFRKSGGSASIASGSASIEGVKGNVVNWNQNYKKNTNYYAISGASYTNNDGVITIQMSTEMYSQIHTGEYVTLYKLPHKFYFSAVVLTNGRKANVSFNNINNNVLSFQNNNKERKANIITGSSNAGNIAFYANETSASPTVTTVENIMLIDLTLIYGKGNEPSTVEQFEADYQKWFGKPLTYEAYNAGELIPVKSTGIKTVGFNQWDEEWEAGGINDSGVKVDSSDYYRSKNYISIFPATSYNFHYPKYVLNVTVLNVYFYDSDKKFIRKNVIGGVNSVLTTPDEAAYMLFRSGGSSPENTYHNDICINLSNAARNGQYEQYWTRTKELPITTLTGKVNGEGESVVVFADGMKKAGTAYDEIYRDANGLVHAVKRIKGVDLGTLTWSKWATKQGANRRFATAGLSSIIKKVTSNNDTGNIICSAYRNASAESNNNEVICVCVDTSGYIAIFDASKIDLTATEFKTAMSGVYLYYELDEPIDYILDDFELPVQYKVDGDGTEEMLPTNESALVTCAAILGIRYVVDAVGTLQELPENYVSPTQEQNFSAAQKSQARTNIGAAALADVESMFASLPTTDPQVAGKLWNDNGVVKISAGE